jgi:hypothetical protein
MKTFLFVACVLFCSNLYSQKAYTPKKGSKERTEILNVFREDFGSEKSSILFKVNHMLVNEDWACALVTPLKNGAEYGDPRWRLFRNINDHWLDIDWAEDIEINDDFELIDLPAQNSRIAQLIVQKHPGCPMDIFGK